MPASVASVSPTSGSEVPSGGEETVVTAAAVGSAAAHSEQSSTSASESTDMVVSSVFRGENVKLLSISNHSEVLN